jgi:hypothetical protein
MHRFLECHFLLSVIAKFFVLAHSIFSMIVAEKKKVQITWHSGMHSSGNLPVQAITVKLMKGHYMSVKCEWWLNSGGDQECVKSVYCVLRLLL